MRVIPIFRITDNTLTVIEDHEDDSSQIVLTIEGENLHGALKCVLQYTAEVQQGEAVHLEVDLLEFISNERVTCAFGGIQWFTEGKVYLKDYNAEKPSLITVSNQVGVELLPRLLIWPDEIEYHKDASGIIITDGFYFCQNLDQ